LDKAQAEDTFGQHVPGHSLFDRMHPQADRVNVILIEKWNVNCCAGPHVESTGKIGTIKVARVNHRPQKQECEFVLELAAGEDPKENKKKKWEKKKKEVVEEPRVEPLNAAQLVQARNVNAITDDILHLVLSQAGVDAERKAQLTAQLQPQLRQKLTTLKNLSYAQGYSAASPASK